MDIGFLLTLLSSLLFPSILPFHYFFHSPTKSVEEREDAQASAIPQLIVQVQTTVANVQDVEMTAAIQEDLAQHHLLPEEQIVDTGYVDADLLVSSRQTYGITLVGPALADNSWQAKAGMGFDVAHFHFDWQAQQGICPEGQTSQRWSLAGERIEVVFAQEVCAACPMRLLCTKSSTTGRVVHVRPQAAHEALQVRRQEQHTPEFRHVYETRAGIEGTISQAVRGMGVRRARYDGLQKTHLQHLLTAVAINVVRIDAILTQVSRGTTRLSHFMRLASHPSLLSPVRT
jgi:transposase